MIEMLLGGRKYAGWKSASVKRALNTIASSADFVISDYEKPRNIPLFAPCVIMIDEQPVITGYIDTVKPSYDASSHSVAISMRSKTADLVDCSAIFASGQIQDRDIVSIINTIIAPFQIKLIFNAANIKINDFQLQQGETAGAAISRICNENELLVGDDAEGNLVITEVKESQSVSKLIHRVGEGSENNNILSGSCEYSRRDMFSEYIVKAQAGGNDSIASASYQAKVADSTVPRYRPLVIVAESQMNKQGAQRRAEREFSSRKGKSTVASYVMQGWLNDSKQLWAPGQCIIIDDDEVRIDGKMMISDVTFNIADGGTTTALEIGAVDAFIPESSSSTKKAKSSTGGGVEGWPELKNGVKI